MSQSISPAGGFTPEVPNNLQCGFCKQPVRGAFYRTLNRFACGSCAGQVKAVADRNVITPAAFLRAVLAGVAVGVACAVAWGVIVKVTGFSIGIIASFIGIAVAKVILAASGKRRGPALQFLAAGISVLGIIGGKVVFFGLECFDALNQNGVAATPATLVRFMISEGTARPAEVFEGFDLLWIGIAVYAAFRMLKRPNITIAGPFPLAPSADDGLQFHTVEPAVSFTPTAPTPDQA